MLHLILGRAGSGKTASVIEKIRALAASGGGFAFLLVPEQYSHEAERELCACVGDSLSLHAEVLSFTALARRVEDERGGPPTMLDRGGKLLCAAVAIDAVSSKLKIYASARRRPGMQRLLLQTIDELKAANLGSGELDSAADDGDSLLRDKLDDLSLILGAYEAVVSRICLDPSDALARLRELIPGSAAAAGVFFIDGFIDFTQQEEDVIAALLKSGADVSVCLSCPSLDDENEIFAHSRRAALSLLSRARELMTDCDISYMEGAGGGSSALDFLDNHLFEQGFPVFGGSSEEISLFAADSIEDECRLAAATAVRLTRDSGCRRRDLAIAVRGFEEYRDTLESAFARYGVPLYMAKKSDITSKPLPTLISSAFSTVCGGWSYEDVFTCLKTGLMGLEDEECDLLENYVFLWSIRGAAVWSRETPWSMHPGGYGAAETEESAALLKRIDALRRLAAAPLSRLERRGAEAATAAGQVAALYGFLEDIGLAARLQTRADALRAAGREQLAAEHVQLWDIVVGALEQCDGILGDMPMTQEEFASLFTLVLSEYSVGAIPVSLDRVSAGDMDRMRRRKIKHLIVLGASDDRLPGAAPESGVFSPRERELLAERGLKIGGWNEDSLERELCLIYNCLSLPSESLTMCYCSRAGDGSDSKPSFVINRIASLLGRDILALDGNELRSWARAPVLELAALSMRGGGDPLCLAAYEALLGSGDGAGRLEDIRAAAETTRGSLSRRAVNELYGDKPRFSPTRINTFSSCRFSYFLKYGLKAAPRTPASFSPPEFGVFMHFILEGVSREIMDAGGFSAVDQAAVERLTDKYVEKYIDEELAGFRDKSERFIYLFRRLTKTVRQIVLDTSRELSRSAFVPLDFELRFSDESGAHVSGNGEVAFSGVADRVDGWLRDGRLYLRVVDYKTGTKNFSLSDVWYGMGLQMLLYLFALGQTGQELYGREVLPAGVLYVPARDVLVRAPGDMSDGEIAKERLKSLRRSGLILDDPALIEAMESGDAPEFIPVSFNRDGAAVGDSLVSAERLGLLSRHIDDTLKKLFNEVKRGSITADPWFRSQRENACLFCDYIEACHFDESRDVRRYQPRLKAPEIWAMLENEKEAAQS